MSLNKPTLKDHLLRSMEQTALDLIVLIRQAGTTEDIKELARKIGNMGSALQ